MIPPRAAPLRTEREPVAGAEEKAGPPLHRRAVDVRIEVGAGNRNETRVLGDEAGAAESALKGCAAWLIAHQQVGCRMGDGTPALMALGRPRSCTVVNNPGSLTCRTMVTSAWRKT